MPALRVAASSAPAIVSGSCGREFDLALFGTTKDSVVPRTEPDVICLASGDDQEEADGRRLRIGDVCRDNCNEFRVVSGET